MRHASVRLIGGPTALIEYGDLRLLTDPAFDPPGEHRAPDRPVVLTKLTGPAVAADDVLPIDAVLLSHDHHADNLDLSGRALLSRVTQVLTTDAGAERLRGNAVGLRPGDTVGLERDVGVTAVRADHGPPDIAATNGPVIGFVLRGPELPALYVSGDNASVAVAREVAAAHGPFDTAILFAGAAELPDVYGPGRYLTLSPQDAVEVSRELGDIPVVPIHQEGWAHFSAGPDDLRAAFTAAGLAGRLRMLAPGEAVAL